MVREATDLDITAVMPLLRSYCDFYKAKPSDEGLERMLLAVIGARQDEAFLLVSEDEASHEVVGAPAVTWLTALDNRRAQAVYDRVGGRSAPFLEYELELS